MVLFQDKNIRAGNKRKLQDLLDHEGSKNPILDGTYSCPTIKDTRWSRLLDSPHAIPCTVEHLIRINGGPETTVKKHTFVLDTLRKSSLSVFNDLVEHTMNARALYKVEKTGRVIRPYCAKVYVNDILLGEGYGLNKYIAKTRAAESALAHLFDDEEFTDDDPSTSE